MFSIDRLTSVQPSTVAITAGLYVLPRTLKFLHHNDLLPERITGLYLKMTRIYMGSNEKFKFLVTIFHDNSWITFLIFKGLFDIQSADSLTTSPPIASSPMLRGNGYTQIFTAAISTSVVIHFGRRIISNAFPSISHIVEPSS